MDDQSNRAGRPVTFFLADGEKFRWTSCDVTGAGQGLKNAKRPLLPRAEHHVSVECVARAGSRRTDVSLHDGYGSYKLCNRHTA